MRLAALLPLMSFFVFIALGVIVYSKNPKAQLNRSFVFLSALFGYYLFTEFMLHNSEVYRSAALWAQLHKISIAFLTPAFLNVVIAYTYKFKSLKTKVIVYSALYIPAIATALIFSLTDIATIGPIKHPWGYDYGLAQNNLIFILLIAWSLMLTTIGGFLLIRNYQKASTARTSRQAKYMLFGIFLPIAITSTVLLFPLLHISSPFMLPAVLVGVFSIIAWTIVKYEVFEVSPDKAVEKIISTMNDSLFVVNESKHISFVNKAALKLLGCQIKDLLDKPLESVTEDSDVLSVFRQDGFNDDMIVNDMEAKLRTKDNKTVKTLLSTSFVLDAAGQTSGIVIVAKDISDWLEAQEKIEHLIYHDFETGLPNSALFQNLLRQAMGFADRNQKPLAVVIIRIGQIKRIKSAYGNELAEELVGAISKQFRKDLRQEDVIGRLGNDELGIVLANINEIDDVAKIVNKIQESISTSVLIRGEQLHLTASIGISLFPNDAKDLDELFQNAVSATNQAEASGPNTRQFFTSKTNAIVNERLKMETDLATGIDRDELVVFYQPQVDIITGKIVGMEALARWRHPQKGIVGAPEFIGIAEESDLITEIDLQILQMACKQCDIWRQKGFGPLVVAVNLSARSLSADIAAHCVNNGMKKDAHPGEKKLEIEITETTVMNNVSAATAAVQKLHAGNVDVAIDDFGTGYSSLSVLRNIQFDTLKIDRAFVKDIETDQAAATIVATIDSMAKIMKLKVIAEGVETKAQVEFLRTLNCHIVQGYYYSPPVPADQFEVLLEKDRLTKPDAA